MVNYQKYMFNDFVVKSDNDEDVFADNEQQNITGEEEFYEEDVTIESNEEENFDEPIEETQNIDTPIQTIVEETTNDFHPYEYVAAEPEVIDNVTTYTEEELKEALAQAEEVAYNKGIEEAKNSLLEKQNILFEDIKNQLMVVFASLEEKKSDLENSALNFAISMIEKILPTMERKTAEKEIKNFLAENFANFSSQEALSFSFNPDMLSHVSDSIRRLAEQNDFEGKISVHKDISLGLSDCRVEWKSGGVERKTSSFINNIKNIVNTNKQERENG